MKILQKFVQQLGKMHAQRLGKVVNRQADPRLHNAILGKLDTYLGKLTPTGSSQINPELEFLEEIYLNNIGLGFLDDIIDVFKLGRYALKDVQYKLTPYLIEYRQALNANLPPLKGRGFIFDFRKGDIANSEITEAMKTIFLKS